MHGGLHALNEAELRTYATSGSYTSHCEFLVGEREATKVGDASLAVGETPLLVNGMMTDYKTKT